jgi:hypothetical protein
MRFLSNLFCATPGTAQWPIIATVISSGFQDVKKNWFEHCVVAVDLGLFADKQEKAKVVRTHLGGAGALAITGYQVVCAKSNIAKNAYLPKASIKDFIELLCSRVSGVETRELWKYIKRYDEVSNETHTQRFRLGVDLARYVINEEPSTTISLHVASLAEKLSAETCMVIANAFGDSAGVHKLSRQITSLERYPVPSGR